MIDLPLISYLCIVLAYLIGSIPSGYLVCRKFYNLDIRQHGSKNIGMTNVYRTCGFYPALGTFMMDVLKGAIFSFILLQVYPYKIALFVSSFLMLGHIFSIFLKFSGGKGVATGLGVFLVFMPFEVCVAVCSFLIVFFIFRYVSLASLIALFLFTILTLYIQKDFFVKSTIIAGVLLIVFKHTSNITRLFKNKELKI